MDDTACWLQPTFLAKSLCDQPLASLSRRIWKATSASVRRSLSDALAELGGARALIREALAVDIDGRRGRAFNRFFSDLRSKGLGDQQPDRDRYQ